MPTLRTFIPPVVASIALLAARGAAAQSTRPICTIRELRTGRLIRVQDTTRASVVGPFLSCSDTLLTLGYGSSDSTRSVRSELIQQMWARDNQRRIGLIAGAAAGAVAGGMIAQSKSEICFKGTPPAATTCHGNVVINALVVGGGGALVGLIVGHSIPRWAKIFP
ncbi:MAG TPA: hypothetical protein VFI79_08575 [Gemmatimonadales bacterium]|nr:hypothetical protein [Gemmatimonadales bacterium]